MSAEIWDQIKFVWERYIFSQSLDPDHGFLRSVKADIICIIWTKLYIQSTLNNDLLLWHTQLIESWFKSWAHFSFHIHWIVYVLAYSNFIFEFQNSFSTAQNGPLCPIIFIMSFIWIVWSTLYVYIHISESEVKTADVFSKVGRKKTPSFTLLLFFSS